MKKQEKRSILKRIMMLVLILVCLQPAVFFGILFTGKTFQSLNNNSTANINNRVMWRAESLENDMNAQWSNLQEFENTFQVEYAKFLKARTINKTQFNENTYYQKEFLAEITPELIQMLRHNKVNGAFLILNGGDEAIEPMLNQKRVKQGIRIRDFDQEANYTENSDLMVSRAPASILEKINIPLDSFWESVFTFSDDTYNDYYYMPLTAVKEQPEITWRQAGYWAPLHRDTQEDINVISYSIPLLDSWGNIIGVAGIEISESYLKKKLPYIELDSSNNGEYILAESIKGSSGYNVIAQNGYAHNSALGKDEKLIFDAAEENNCRRLMNSSIKQEIYGSIYPLNLYQKSDYYSNQQWYMIGILNKRDLYSFSIDITRTLIMASGIALLLALVSSAVMSKRLVRPIRAVAERIKQINPNENIFLPRTKIDEIDRLITEIELLQNNVLENNRKLSEIINLAGLPISAFEINRKKKTVFFTDYFFNILDYKVEEEEKEKLKDYQYFINKFRMQDEAIVSKEQEGNKKIANYYFKNKNGEDKWARVHAIMSEDRVIGIMMDVSREYIEKNKLQHERDHDLLTNLFNRRAFRSKMTELFKESQQIGIGAMIMIDLDNLKYINDSYGHDCGDGYIKVTAEALMECVDKHTLIGRMSGDEFNIFLMHYETEEQVREKINKIYETIRSKNFQTIREKLPVRMTGGIAWFPKDGDNYEDLIHLADFAMYQAKRNAKGEFKEFDKEIYARDSFLLKNRGELNSIIENELVEYHFQPIVNLQTGEIFAYEALMRPMGEFIKRPDEILALAKTQGRLYHIERLTWFKSLKDFSENEKLMNSDCRLFINSISNQVLSLGDFQAVGETYPAFVHRIVMELTEEERLNNEYTEIKINHIRKWNAELALDDFGSGYNGENLLLDLNPNYIKIDMNIIRNIDKDEKRQIIFNNLISYARSRGIKVIAEGVETREELLYVKENGADFVQGYFIAKPKKNPEDIPAEIYDLLLS